MAMIQTFNGPRQLSLPTWFIPLWDFAGSCAERLIRYHSKWRTAKLLARLDCEVLDDIGVPHDRMSRTTGTLDRYPDIIKTCQSNI